MPFKLQIQIRAKKLVSAVVPTVQLAEYSPALEGSSKGFCLIMPASCLPSGICNFPGPHADGCLGCANSRVPGGCRA